MKNYNLQLFGFRFHFSGWKCFGVSDMQWGLLAFGKDPYESKTACLSSAI